LNTSHLTHTIVVTACHDPSLPSRLTTLIAQRGWEVLAFRYLREADDRATAEVTVTGREADPATLIAQLERLVPVLAVERLTRV
jgi:acetolactate synthase regulatory subunit